MEKDFTGGKHPEFLPSEKSIERDTFYIGDKDASSFAIAVDPSGKLGWESNHINGDHIIEILAHQATEEYISLIEKGSPIFLPERQNWISSWPCIS